MSMRKIYSFKKSVKYMYSVREVLIGVWIGVADFFNVADVSTADVSAADVVAAVG